MAKKRKNQVEHEDLTPNEGPFIPSNADEKILNDTSNFIDDTPRHWVANTKSVLEKDRLSVKQHLLIYHVAVIAGWFSDDLYPTLKDKCIQYHHERNLLSMGVTAESFYKSYSSIEFSDLKVPIIERKRPKRLSKNFIETKKPKYRSIKKKYIELELIESVFPFILKWYPSAALFVQTLNNDPYRLNEEHFYWIYRRVKDLSTRKIKLKIFFENNCPHLNFNAFKSHDYRQSGNKIPSDIKTHINPYIRLHFPDILEAGKKIRKEKQEYYRKKVFRLYREEKNEYPHKFKHFMKKYFPNLNADSTKHYSD